VFDDEADKLLQLRLYEAGRDRRKYKSAGRRSLYELKQPQQRNQHRRSEYGNDLLKNFVFGVCDCEGKWSMENFIEIEMQKIRETVGDKQVLCALSGGVDSSVVQSGALPGGTERHTNSCPLCSSLNSGSDGLLRQQ
jgi:predicted PP-loop superfamily ATPase